MIKLLTAVPVRVGFVLLFTAMLAMGVAGSAMSQEQHAVVGEVDGMINPVTQRYISRVIDRGEDDGAELVIIKLDTPGGLLSSTKKIVQKLLDASVPTAVYVYPSGADAASAGTFITAAANFAVMAPGTTIGAASPVGSGGEDIPDTLKSKVIENTTALMRNIAEQRGRNAEALEDTVTKATAYDTAQAVDLDVVDFVANSIPDLLREIDGVTVETSSGEVTLDTDGLVLRDVNMSVVEKFLFFLADPNIAFLFLSLGGLGLIIELFNPGTLIPGLVGVILLLLAFLSLGNLPVNWAAAGFILLAGALVVAEIFVAGFGVLGIAAIISFIFGGLLLFESFGSPSPTAPSVKVNLYLLGSFAGLISLSGFWFVRTVVQSRQTTRLSPVSTTSPLIGVIGEATSDLAPRGTVHLESEVWTAVAEGDIVIKTGEKVKVVKVDGLIVTVTRP